MAQRYHAFVEVDDRTPITRDTDLKPWIAVLEQYSGAPGTSPRGFRQAGLYVTGDDLVQAAITAASIVSGLYGAPAVSCEVMTEAEFLGREGWVDIPDMVSVTDAAEQLGVTRQAVLDRVRRGTLQATKVGDTYVLPRAQPALAPEAG